MEGKQEAPKPLTVRQLMGVLRQDIAWLRIYPEGQRHDYLSAMTPKEIQEAIYIYGDRAVWRVYPGMGYVFFYLV